MFWGLILKTNKKYSQTLKTSFHLSQASLDESASNDEPVQVMYMQDDNSYLLCTLQKNKTTQCALDLNFATGDKVCFSTKGHGIVHLTGFLVPDELDFEDEDELGALDEEDEELEDSEEEVKVDKNDLRNKLKKDKKEDKKPVQKLVPEEDSDSSGEEEESEDDSAEEPDTTMEAAGDDDESDDSESEDEDDDDEEEEDDSDDEEVEEPKAKQMKLDKDKKKPQNGLQNGHKEENKKQKKDKENKQQQQQQQQQQKPNETGKIQKLQGGLTVQELKVGNGNVAKNGKKVQVYYEGRLQSNNKMFDSTKQGPGFKFTLGRNEVIRGWDLGVVGMKVGGKRKLTIPPTLAYGSKGSPPVIPPNSTLVFDVELKNVLN